MVDTSSDLYKSVQYEIESFIDKNYSWDSIKNLEFMKGGNSLEEKIELFNNSRAMTYETWLEYVNNIRFYIENGFDIAYPPSSFISNGPLNNFSPHLEEGSAWQVYSARLSEIKIAQDDINNICGSATKILNNLSLNTESSEPIKGLVIGNVQSGKTANMGALMSMAADEGWNMFIILSGTIENLRIQTQERFINDLMSKTCNISWHGLENYDMKGNNRFNKLCNIDLSKQSPNRYLYVCLKNSSRLQHLLKWLSSDEKKRAQLKILIIDDEADQAGINSAKLNKNAGVDEQQERTKINQLIVNLFTNKDEKGNIVNTQFRALNYVAYTATPYANVLNEGPSICSTYPKDFVASLEPSKKYFGPQTIFGITGTDCDGMNIINSISEDDVKQINLISSGQSDMIPKGLKDSILWFCCCFAIYQYRKINKPISMLIHTSQQIAPHQEVARAITKWLSNYNHINFIKDCERVYKEQTNMLTKTDFINTCKEYPNSDKILNYPRFDEIATHISNIFKSGVKHIKIVSDDKPVFPKGIILCIDDSRQTYGKEDTEHIRLLYPKDNLDYPTGYIVIGGATLSRGLTIEGLVSSYFLRTIKQSDTLMQMGRWFGYRPKRELLPRIWMENDTRSKFEFLSALDYELRENMKYMEEMNLKPGQVAIKIKNYPKRTQLDITSRNKQKDAILVDLDFSGLATQTTMFFDDDDILKDNIDRTDKFISTLGDPIDLINHVKSEDCFVWKNIKDKIVLDFIESMVFPHKGSSFLDTSTFAKWYTETAQKNGFEDWNVVLAGIDREEESKKVTLGGYTIHKVNRSKKADVYGDNIIRIGALRHMKDLYVDIDITDSNLTKEDIGKINDSSSKGFKLVRKHSSEGNKSLLVIYVVDKDSQPRKSDTQRVAMNTKHDVIGLTIVVPQGNSDNSGSYISINSDKLDSDFGE